MFHAKNQLGQGLVEALLAFLLIAGAAIALIRFQSDLAYGDNLNQQQNRGIILATKQIETLKHFSTLTGANSYDSIGSGSSAVTSDNTTYTVSWNVGTNTDP